MNFCDSEMRVNCVDRLARIEQMLKDRVEQTKHDRQRMDKILISHENRISMLEKWRHWILGTIGICGGIVVGFWQWLKNHLQLDI